jgi:hypothetical protein
MLPPYRLSGHEYDLTEGVALLYLAIGSLHRG